MSTHEQRSASSDRDIEFIDAGTDEISRRHLIIGGRSGSGLELATVLASRGDGVLFTHSGNRKPKAVEESLDRVRTAFSGSVNGGTGDAETDVIAIGGDVTTDKHREQIVRATQLWLPVGQNLNSLTLAAARGTQPVRLGETAQEPDPEYATDLNLRGLLSIFNDLRRSRNSDGSSLLEGATVVYPTSSIARQWGDPDAIQPDFYKDVGPSKRAAQEAIMAQYGEMARVDGRVITAVMGLILGTLVARGIKSHYPEFLETAEAQRTTIDEERAGQGMAEIILDKESYPNGSVVHILPESMFVE